jgi:hypothetical protein
MRNGNSSVTSTHKTPPSGLRRPGAPLALETLLGHLACLRFVDRALRGTILGCSCYTSKAGHRLYHKEHGSVHFKSTNPPEPVNMLLRHSISHVRVQFGLHLHRQGLHTAGCLQALVHAALCRGSSMSQWSAMHWSTEPKQSLPRKVPSRGNC